MAENHRKNRWAWVLSHLERNSFADHKQDHLLIHIQVRLFQRPLPMTATLVSTVITINCMLNGNFILFFILLNAEHLTEQEANDEIRSLLQSFVAQLQAVKDRAPSTGTAISTIATLLASTKPMSNSNLSLLPPPQPAPVTIKQMVYASENFV